MDSKLKCTFIDAPPEEQPMEESAPQVCVRVCVHIHACMFMCVCVHVCMYVCVYDNEPSPPPSLPQANDSATAESGEVYKSISPADSPKPDSTENRPAPSQPTAGSTPGPSKHPDKVGGIYPHQ